ncbi:hypothetical protein NL676_023650 [Syzygium grande]|nr:hypothetical protein NL676_023650 [Syzygium grande]
MESVGERGHGHLLNARREVKDDAERVNGDGGDDRTMRGLLPRRRPDTPSCLRQGCKVQANRLVGLAFLGYRHKQESGAFGSRSDMSRIHGACNIEISPRVAINEANRELYVR